MVVLRVLLLVDEKDVQMVVRLVVSSVDQMVEKTVGLMAV